MGEVAEVAATQQMERDMMLEDASRKCGSVMDARWESDCDQAGEVMTIV